MSVEAVLARLSTKDAGELLTLQRAAYVTEAQAHHDLALPPLTQTLDDLLAELAELADPAVLALGLREGGRLVAAVRVRVDGTDGLVGRLVVAPDRQRHGLGGGLLREVERQVPAGVGWLRLFTGERSTGNLRLYARHGYVEDRRTDAGHYQLVHLSKALPATRPPSG